MLFKGFAILCCLVGLTACGYRCCGYERGSVLPLTLNLPFVEGDRDGLLTQALIYEIGLRTPFIYSCGEANYLLKVKLMELDQENIGFRYDRNRKGKLKHTIIPTEMRLRALAEIVLCSIDTGEVLLAPALVEASVDFDHDYYFDRDAVNVFSLGQLADVDAAREAALLPLNRALARNIADFLALYPR